MRGGRIVESRWANMVFPESIGCQALLLVRARRHTIIPQLAVARQRQETRRGAPRVADLLGENQASSTDCLRFAATWLVCRLTGVAFIAVGTDQVHEEALQHAVGVGPWDPNDLHRLGPRSLVGLPYSNREGIRLSAAKHY
jgi:hypothetical protein